MMTDRVGMSESDRELSHHAIKFGGGIGMLLIVLMLTVVQAYTSRVLRAMPVGPAIPYSNLTVTSAVLSLGLVVAVVWVLRREDVQLLDLGLAPRLALPAVVAVGAFYAIGNLGGAAIAFASGNTETVGYQWTVSPMGAVFAFVVMLVFAGLVEEFVFRGYIQTKCIALLGGGRLSAIGLGVVIAGVLFSLSHIPRILVSGAPSGLSPEAYLLMLGVNGVVYGLLYEWTHNLYVPILVHAAGNMPGTAGIYFLTTTGWSAWAAIAYQLTLVSAFVLVLVAYRRWAGSLGVFPVWGDRTTVHLFRPNVVYSTER